MENQIETTPEGFIVPTIADFVVSDDSQPAPIGSEETEAEAIAAAETAILPSAQAITVPKGTPENPHGHVDPAHPIKWHGRTINGVEWQGSGATSRDCLEQAAHPDIQSATCHMHANPDYVDPNPIIAPVPFDATAAAINGAYTQGYQDADAAYQDLKALVLNYANELVANNSGMDMDQIPMVVYARNNR